MKMKRKECEEDMKIKRKECEDIYVTTEVSNFSHTVQQLTGLKKKSMKNDVSIQKQPLLFRPQPKRLCASNNNNCSWISCLPAPSGLPLSLPHNQNIPSLDDEDAQFISFLSPHDFINDNDVGFNSGTIWDEIDGQILG
ncbi:hypothetical protein SUGI_0194510 [Cryptomeria japonica]|nr:hypothetical protein SUGI_0194510 [Cryptomeria japonica]